MEAKKKRKFDFKWLCRLKTKLYIGPPNFFLNFKSFFIEKMWGDLVPIFVNLTPKNGLWPMDYKVSVKEYISVRGTVHASII